MSNYKQILKPIKVIFNCPICGKEIETIITLDDLPDENHMTKLSIDKIGKKQIPFKCQNCNRKFTIKIFNKNTRYFIIVQDNINKHNILSAIKEEIE